MIIIINSHELSTLSKVRTFDKVESVEFDFVANVYWALNTALDAGLNDDFVALPDQ